MRVAFDRTCRVDSVRRCRARIVLDALVVQSTRRARHPQPYRVSFDVHYYPRAGFIGAWGGAHVDGEALTRDGSAVRFHDARRPIGPDDADADPIYEVEADFLPRGLDPVQELAEIAEIAEA